VTEVAEPGMMPFVGPTGYVFPLSHTAETVSEVGVTMTSVKFQAMVTVWEGASLKYDVAVCGGKVMTILPAGAEAGMTS